MLDDSARVVPGGAYGRDPAPISHQGGDVGVLALHGFNGVPGELRSLTAALIDAGCSVEAPLLAGHGGTQEQLGATTWHDWVASIDAPIARLRARCRTVVLVGFSMGGAIALYRAAHDPALDGVATISTPTHLGSPLIHLVPLARRVIPYVYPLRRLDLSNPAVVERLRTYFPDLDVDTVDPASQIEAKRTVKVSLEAVYQLTRLMRAVRAGLWRVTVPALLIQARDDEQTPRSSLSILATGLSAARTQMVYFAHGGHMLPVGPARAALAARVVAYVRQAASAIEAEGASPRNAGDRT